MILGVDEIHKLVDEVGLEIERPKYVCDLVFVRPDGYPAVTLSYWAKYKSGEVMLNHEHTDRAWVTLEEARGYDLIDGIWDEIRQVDEALRIKIVSQSADCETILI